MMSHFLKGTWILIVILLSVIESGSQKVKLRCNRYLFTVGHILHAGLKQA